MYIRNRKHAQPVRFENGEHTYELLGRVEGMSSEVSIAYVELDAGHEALRHQHVKTEETFYILSGQGIAKLDNDKITVQQGDCIHIKAGCCHSLLNNTQEKLIYLSICSPAWLRHSGTMC